MSVLGLTNPTEGLYTSPWIKIIGGRVPPPTEGVSVRLFTMIVITIDTVKQLTS